VEKSGLNGTTTGAIAYVDVDVKNFVTPTTHQVYLNQVLVRPANGTAHFSYPGDSGALIVTPEERFAVALLVGESFAGAERLTFATPIDDVLTALAAGLITR